MEQHIPHVYATNEEPQIGDQVRFNSQPGEVATHEVTDIGGGRLGNKVYVRPLNDKEGYCQGYYYYCFVLMTPVAK